MVSSTRQQISTCGITMLTVLGLTACAGQPAGPDAGMRGVGTPGVSTYLRGDQTISLQAMLDRCRQIPQQTNPNSGDRGLSVACDQLRRTLHSQPGNTVKPGAVP